MSMDALLPIMVSFLGTLALFFPYVAPRAKDEVTALVFSPLTPPATVLRDISALDLPIRDIRWNGRLVELDLSHLSPEQRLGLTSRLATPALQIAVRPTALCAQ